MTRKRTPASGAGVSNAANVAPEIFVLAPGATLVDVTTESTDDARLVQLAQEADDVRPTGAITVEPDAD